MSSTCSMSSHRLMETQNVSVTPVPISCIIPICTNRELSYWYQRSRHSRITIHPRHNAYGISHGCSKRLEIRWNANGSLPTPKNSRERRGDFHVALKLSSLPDTNRMMGLRNEGTEQTKEASETFERLGGTVGQAQYLIDLAWLMHDVKKLYAAEETASCATDLLQEEGQQVWISRGHRVPGRARRRRPFTISRCTRDRILSRLG